MASPPPSINTGFLGFKRTDALNGIEPESPFASSIGKNNPLSKDERIKHQKELLDYRLDNLISALNAHPSNRKIQLLPFSDNPYTAISVPIIEHVRVSPVLSFSGLTLAHQVAANKFKRDFSRADAEVREYIINRFGPIFENYMTSKTCISFNQEFNFGTAKVPSQEKNWANQFLNSLKKIHFDPKKNRDFETLDNILNAKNAFNRFDDNPWAHLRLARRLNELQSPSAYENYLSSNRPKQVLNTHLNDFNGKLRVLADQIRAVHNDNGDNTEVQLRELRVSVRDILYSGNRHTLHRLIKEMTKQIKRSGTQLPIVLPNNPNLLFSIAQKLRLFGGLGKQQRRQFKAKSMEDAFFQIVEHTKQSENRVQLFKQQLAFTGSKIQSDLKTVLSNSGQKQSGQKQRVLDFLNTRKGALFVNWVLNSLRKKNDSHDTTQSSPLHELKQSLQKKPFTANSVKSLQKLLNNNSQLVDDFFNAHQHEFMVTADPEFWHRESVGKLWTKFKDRTFKQAVLRSALFGLNHNDVAGYMAKGIKCSLDSKNMIVETSKVTALMGTAMGNLVSAPIAAALAAVTKIPILAAFPHDIWTMPVGYLIGSVLSPFVTPVLSWLKHRKLQEINASINVLPILDSENATQSRYISDARSGLDLKTRTEPLKKPTFQDLTPNIKTGGFPLLRYMLADIRRTHGPQLKTLVVGAFEEARNFLKFILPNIPQALGAAVRALLISMGMNRYSQVNRFLGISESPQSPMDELKNLLNHLIPDGLKMAWADIGPELGLWKNWLLGNDFHVFPSNLSSASPGNPLRLKTD